MDTAPKKELSLFDSTCIIVGIIIGVGIYQMSPDIAKGVYCWWGVLVIWTVGGLLSLFGALGYAELASAYPREGGDYVYLSRAYGRWSGFLFGWAQLVITRPGDIAVMAFAFAMYARIVYNPFPDVLVPYGALYCKLPFVGPSAAAAVPLSQLVYAGGAVVVLTVINILGVKEGKWTQNFLTVLKTLGLLAIVCVAVIAPQSSPITETFEPFPLSVALIFVLFVYGGWNEMAYVAAEVKNPNRNIVRALVLGTVAVMVLYLLVNGAFLYTLGYNGLAGSDAVATDSISTVFRDIGGPLISSLVCISALGAVNGLIFTGARISYAMGAEHRIFGALGKWKKATGTPVWALLVQGVIALILIVWLGSFVSAILYTAPVVYSFYLATSVAVIVLRKKEHDVQRPYRVTGYPVTTLVFCAVCIFLIYSAVVYKPLVAAAACVVLLIGALLYLIELRCCCAD